MRTKLIALLAHARCLSLYDLLLIKPNITPRSYETRPYGRSVQVARIFHHNPETVGKTNANRSLILPEAKRSRQQQP
jgi:hypothetical protein